MAEPLPAIGMTFAEAAEVYQQKLKTDLRFKPRTKGKRRVCIAHAGRKLTESTRGACVTICAQ